MKTLPVFTVLFWFTPLLLAEMEFLGSKTDSEGNRLDWNVPIELVEATSMWDGTSPIPFRLDELVDAAREYLAQEHALSETLPVEGLWLQRVNRAAVDPSVLNRWFLTINFGGEASELLESSVRILTDGTIVIPTNPIQQTDEEDGD